MEIKFWQIQLADVRGHLSQYLGVLPSAIDSFLEAHILESNHYQIYLAGELAGFAAVHKSSLITHFSLSQKRRHIAQTVFAQVKKLEEVQAALVPTCDEFFLAHALDEYRQLAKQAYFFAPQSSLLDPGDLPYRLRLADKDDLELIAQGSGDFFGDAEGIAQKLNHQTIYLVIEEDNPIGFGVLERSELLEGVASIGMFVMEQHRQRGVGAAILRLLGRECERLGLRFVAGCWYYNHLSKKTLERSGMFTQTRLLRIEF